MLFRRFRIILILIFVLLISACGGQAVQQETPQTQTPQPEISIIFNTPTPPPESFIDSENIPLLEHPDKLSVEFSESVTERDRRLVNMAIDITLPLFEAHGIPLRAEIYIAGDKDYFFEMSEMIFGQTPEESQQAYGSERGSMHEYSGQIIINVPLHDILYEGSKRDGTFVFTIAHELYHILQVKLSQGWSGPLPEPPWITEASANLGAFRAIAKAFCKPLYDVSSAIASFQVAPECSDEVVLENILYKYARDYLTDPSENSSIELYLIARFGLGAYDNYYIELPNNAPTSEEEYAQTDYVPWFLTFRKVFNVSSPETFPETFIETANFYIVDHQEELFKAFAIKEDESSGK